MLQRENTVTFVTVPDSSSSFLSLVDSFSCTIFVTFVLPSSARPIRRLRAVWFQPDLE